MEVNPDNFVFHSDFWYPTNYVKGYHEYVNHPIPHNFLLSDKYEDGDYYSAFAESNLSGNDYVYDLLTGMSLIGNTIDNKLYGQHGAQSIGAKFNGRIHYRIYKNSNKFNFLSESKPEKILFTKEGNFDFDYSFGSTNLPTEITEPYYVRGVWSLNGGPYYSTADIHAKNGYTFSYAYKENNFWNAILSATINGPFSTQPGNNIKYKIIGISLYD